MLELAHSIKCKVIDSHMCFVHAIYQNSAMLQSRELRELLMTDMRVLCHFVMVSTDEWANPSVVGLFDHRST